MITTTMITHSTTTALVDAMNALFPRCPMPARFLWAPLDEGLEQWAAFWCDVLRADTQLPKVQWNRTLGKFEAMKLPPLELMPEYSAPHRAATALPEDASL